MDSNVVNSIPFGRLFSDHIDISCLYECSRMSLYKPKPHPWRYARIHEWLMWITCVSLVIAPRRRGPWAYLTSYESAGPSSSPQHPDSSFSHFSFPSRSYTAYTLFHSCRSSYYLPVTTIRHAKPNAHPEATQEVKIWMSRV